MPTYSFTLNGEPVSVDVPGDVGLLYVMRDLLGVTGPKYGCGVGVCRACTCHVDGEEFQPCITRTSEVEGREVTSIEGLADGEDLHPLQEAWIDLDVAQCGYCQPGQIMTAAALLDRPGRPGQISDQEIDQIQNICRCGTYFRIRSAIKQAAAGMAPGNSGSAGSAAGAGTTAGSADGDGSASADEDQGGVLDGLLGGASGASVEQATLPATGGGVGGAAALVAAAAAAVRRGRESGPDEAAGSDHAAEPEVE